MTKHACINLRPAKNLKFNLGERLSLSSRDFLLAGPGSSAVTFVDGHFAGFLIIFALLWLLTRNYYELPPRSA